MSDKQPAAIDEATLKKAEEFVEQEEGAANRLRGWIGHGVSLLAVGATLFHLYAAYDIVPTQTLRPVHVGLVLVLVFLLFPVSLRFRDGIRWWDLIGVAGAIATVGYMLVGGEDFRKRIDERIESRALAMRPAEVCDAHLADPRGERVGAHALERERTRTTTHRARRRLRGAHRRRSSSSSQRTWFIR